MRRSDPHLVTYLLVFLLIYTLVTGTLLFVLRSIVLEDRLETLEKLERRSQVLDETMRLRSAQEREIIIELMSVAGARDFEDAYAMLRAEIEELSEQYDAVEAAATTERDLRIETVRERDRIVSRVQALELEISRLEANRNLCLERLASCSDC